MDWFFGRLNQSKKSRQRLKLRRLENYLRFTVAFSENRGRRQMCTRWPQNNRKSTKNHVDWRCVRFFSHFYSICRTYRSQKKLVRKELKRKYIQKEKLTVFQSLRIEVRQWTSVINIVRQLLRWTALFLFLSRTCGLSLSRLASVSLIEQWKFWHFRVLRPTFPPS